MKRAPLLFAVLSIVAYAFSGIGAGRFDVRLSADKQTVHVLNRLTFGPRPGDAAEVKKIGIEKWIDQQLHPERIPENPELEAKLQPLLTLNLQTWEIAEKSTQQQAAFVLQAVNMSAFFTQLQNSKLLSGSAEERRAVIDSIAPEKRDQLLASIPPAALEGLPDLQQEAAKLRQAAQQERQMQLRKLNPPLNELLSQDEIRIARTGTERETLALFNSMEPEKRKQVLRAIGPQPLANLPPQLRREAMAIQQPQQLASSELIENKLLRAIYSNHQLEEVLVDFWINHFNVYIGKNQIRLMLTSYERDTIRPHVFGHFKDLLLATAKSPAMLVYLDNAQSQAPREDLPTPLNPNGQPFRRPGLNENYGRELMELHTLGVDGGYTQDDVIAVARALTGWTVFEPGRYSEYQFNPAMHDRKEKVVLERQMPAGRGEQDGLDVIDILAHHPSTAKFISKKLAQRFVADEPPQTLIDRMAATFTKTDGDLRAVLQTMFTSVEFLSEGAWQAKLKSPLEMVVGSVRALNAEVNDTTALAQRIAELGQPLYGKVEPTGYPNTGESWASTAGLLGRINFATALTSGQVSGVKPDISRFNFKTPADVASDILSIAPSPATLDAMQRGIEGREATPSMLATLVLGSPEFQRK
jgi:uncharacterized protein (DUF1800 family)